MISKTQQALELLAKTPSMTPRAAALEVGISPAAVYQAIKAREGKNICPCCGQVVREGFELKKPKAK